jgi:large subunit ribosomal protein L7/L12
LGLEKNHPRPYLISDAMPRPTHVRFWLFAGLLLSSVAEVRAQAAVEAPLRPHPKSPVYQLSNLRKLPDSPFGDLALDFTREGDTSAAFNIVLVTRDSRGRQDHGSIGSFAFAKKEGTVKLRVFGGGIGSGGLEMWLELHQFMAGKTYRQKISNSVTMGSVAQTTEPRDWNAEETKAFEQWEKSITPPPAPPKGYLAVASEAALLPGMPLLAGWSGEWKQAEVIDVRKEGAVLVKYRDYPTVLIVRPRTWLAIEQKTLDAGRTNPAQFVASAKVLPGGSTPVPADLEPVTSAVPLVKGAPLKAEWGSKWNDVTVLDVLSDSRVRIHWDGWSNTWDEDRDLSTLMVTKQTLADLKKPGAKEQFAERLEKQASTFGSARPGFASRQLKDYPIRIAIPGNAVRINAETPVQEGTKLGCSWGSRWYDVTVLAVHDDGTLKIRWDQYGSAWDGDISRECLIIDKKVLQKLENQARAASKPASTPAAGDNATPGGKYRVVLAAYGTRKIAVTKVVAEVTGLELKDALQFVEELPFTVKQGLTKDAATKLKKQLDDAGGVTKIEGP